MATLLGWLFVIVALAVFGPFLAFMAVEFWFGPFRERPEWALRFEDWMVGR